MSEELTDTERYAAILWIHNKTCRVLIYHHGVICDSGDFRNRAAAELAVVEGYSGVHTTFIPEDDPHVEDLNNTYENRMETEQ